MVIHQSEQNNNNSNSNSGVSSTATSTSTIISTSTNTSSSSATTASTEEEEEEGEEIDNENLNSKDIQSTTLTSTQKHQHDPILRNEDGSMLTTPQNIPMVISKDQNKLIHLDPVPNFKDKADIKPWLQKIFYPMGIEIVIERSDNTKVVFKCKASKRGRKSRKSSTNGTPNNTTSTFEDTVKECAEKFIIHDNKMKNDLKTNTPSSVSTPPSSSSPRGKKKRAVSSFNVCPFRIRATYSIRRLKWSIVVVNNIHSHELNFDPDSDEYKKFKAKLREDNDLEAIKKFDELEYRKRSNLPIQTAMIPCDCGLTNEIESFNIVIPNANPKPISTMSKRNILKKKIQQPKDVSPPTSGSKRTINDLIMKKTDKAVSASAPPAPSNNSPPPTKPTATATTTNEQISLDDIINNYSNMPLKSTNSNLINLDWNINLLSDNGPQNSINSNHLLYNLMNTTANTTPVNTIFKTNNDSQTDIIQARDKIEDEENDEEVGVPLQRDNKDYEYNGTNQIANEYYHNDLDSYNTDHFYKFNGPFDSGNAVLINKYNNHTDGNNMNHELLSNNFIDDPLINESHINSIIYNTNLELNINIMAPNINTANNTNTTTTNENTTNQNLMNYTPESWTNINDNINPTASNTTIQPVNNDFNTINPNNNLIDLNEIDFTDIFTSTSGSFYKHLPKQEESPFSKPDPISMIKSEHPSPHSNIPQPTTGETLSNELKQFIVHLEETSKTQNVTITPVIPEEDEEEPAQSK